MIDKKREEPSRGEDIFNQMNEAFGNFVVDLYGKTTLSREEKEQLGSKITNVLKNFSKIPHEFWTPERYGLFLDKVNMLNTASQQAGWGGKFYELEIFIVLLRKLKENLEKLPQEIEEGKKEVHKWIEDVVRPSLITSKK